MANVWKIKITASFIWKSLAGKCSDPSSFTILEDAETPVIKPGSIINIEENEKVIELKVIRINWINLDTMTCNIEAFYHEKEAPISVRRKNFRVI